MRRGCDLNPIDLTGEEGRRVLTSFVWPEHVERFQRLGAAIDAFRPVTIDRAGAGAGAGAWLTSVLAEPAAGVTTVVFHSIVLPYLSDAERAEVDDLLAAAAAGARATDDAPLAHVAMEPVGEQYEEIVLPCHVWPGDRRFRLATCTPHGRSIAWDPVPIDPPLAG